MTDQQQKTKKKKVRAEVEAENESLWPKIRQLLVFQAKLYVDAFRDLVMSPVSIVIVIIDLVQENEGEDSLFESLLRFGRKTERFINLFNQHDGEDDNANDIDTIINEVEETVLKEDKSNTKDSAKKDDLADEQPAKETD